MIDICISYNYSCDFNKIMEELITEDIQRIRIENKYEILDKLGEGTFGKIFSGKNIYTNEEVAIKIENVNDNILLKNEAMIYKLLEKVSGVPKLRGFGKIDCYQYLIIDKLGLSLEDLRIKCGGKFSLKTVLMIAIQIITRIENIHKQGLIHRDIKPDNFLMGDMNTITKSRLYLIDFGLSRLYIDENGEHIEPQTGRKIVGTTRYISINIHNGITPSRRDDLESIGYMLIYLLLGKLPWQKIQMEDRDKKIEKIGEYKKEKHICSLFPNVPYEFILYLQYCRNLHYDEDPNYRYLKNIFINLFKLHGFEYDYEYDWCIE